MSSLVSLPHTEIRLAQPDDAEAIAQVLRAAFSEYEDLYTPEGFRATTPQSTEIGNRMNEGPLWVAVVNEMIVGTSAAVLKGDSLYIRGMAVLPIARGQHIGEQLLKQIASYAVAHQCRSMFLSTTPFLHHAIRLYEEFGFSRSSEGPRDLFGTPLFTMEKCLITETS